MDIPFRFTIGQRVRRLDPDSGDDEWLIQDQFCWVSAKGQTISYGVVPAHNPTALSTGVLEQDLKEVDV